MIQELIKLVECFDSKDSKIYWIQKMSISDSCKGFLLIYFNL